MKSNEAEEFIVGPQEGPQRMFLESSADIVLFGGGAGGGKSYGLLLEPINHLENSRFGSVIFRRNTVQVRNEGGLWDESFQLYAKFGARAREAILEWEFPSGMRVKFAHLENEHTVYDWQGSQIAYIGFDELTHFSEKQFFYMLSRNRSMSGVPGFVRATCNPDADSWIRTFIDWWIDVDGYPIKERCGVVRWFIRQDDKIVWADSRQELLKIYGADQLPKSFTFIQSLIHDNKILLAKDPAYLANLHALSRVERMRLLGGNWNVRATAGTIFQREWFPVLDEVPGEWTDFVRYWDRAATKPNETNKDPDWTRGLKLAKYRNGTFCVVDLKSARGTPLEIENLIKNTASHDGRGCRIVGEQDPGSAGVADAQNFVRMLAGYNVRTNKVSTDKVTRARPVSAQAEHGNIKIIRAPWNDEFFRELENFPDGKHDDIIDVLSGAFNDMAGGFTIGSYL